MTTLDQFHDGRNQHNEVHHWPANINTVISPDGSRIGIQGVGGSQHFSASFNHIFSFPDLQMNILTISVTTQFNISLLLSC